MKKFIAATATFLALTASSFGWEIKEEVDVMTDKVTKYASARSLKGQDAEFVITCSKNRPLMMVFYGRGVFLGFEGSKEVAYRIDDKKAEQYNFYVVKGGKTIVSSDNIGIVKEMMAGNQIIIKTDEHISFFTLQGLTETVKQLEGCGL